MKLLEFIMELDIILGVKNMVPFKAVLDILSV